jgi:ATP-dependent DNA helicase RecG
VPTLFGSAQPLDDESLVAAPIRYPRPSRLSEPVGWPGPKAEKAAATLGLSDVGALLEHLPRDRREARSVIELIPGENATIVVDVRSIASRSVRRRGMKPLVEAVVGDDSGTVRVTFFNQPWLVSRYPVGTRIVMHGKLDPRRGTFNVSAHAPTTLATAGIGSHPPTPEPTVAHYPTSEGLTSTQIMALVAEHADAFADVLEPLSAPLRTAERLLDRAGALRACHFPVGEGDAELGRRRLAFDELLMTQLVLMRRRRERSSGAVAAALAGSRSLTTRWIEELLPFPPTGDQQLAFSEIDDDLAGTQPMQRLLMGEVGSGKTVVALFAMLRAIEHDMQAALMAPTETLAEQHFATIQKLLGNSLVNVERVRDGQFPGVEPIRAALLTGSTPGRRRAEVLARLSSGELSLIVGTHALIEDDVRFAALGVAVVDEQHRFGVRQRAALDAKAGGPDGAGRPHMLHMTATPIPRTLALAGYGDLDFTVLRELPHGRRPIATHVCSTDPERARAYDRLREELRAGRQAFVVCPLVEESELLEARAATAEYERLRAGELRDFRVVLMHGQMRSAAKQAAMASFAAHEADVLVATTVIEVGIDIPNATVMLVEDAERYGISQLHQLRGRIGRGEHASLCLLFGGRESVRLKALARESDGFKLAEIDLQLRGEGELVGTRQSGLQQFRFALFPDDAELLERARIRADQIAAGGAGGDLLSAPEHAMLGDALLRSFGEEFSTPIPA